MSAPHGSAGISEPTAHASPTGPLTRLGLGVQVATLVLLGAAAAGLLTWISGRPALHLRWDTTSTGSNTIDPALVELLRKLPGKATAEIFLGLGRVPGPFDAAAAEAGQRMREFLFIAQNQVPDKLKVIDHDLSDVEPTLARMTELGVVGETDVVVVQAGGRRAVLRLFRDIARVVPPDPAMRSPARIESFRGEEALGAALMKVSAGEAVRILFSTGHGERELYGTGARELGALHTALVGEGFEVDKWDPSREPAVPRDCRVLAIVAPEQPFLPEEVEAVARFVQKGGRLLVAPGLSPEAYDGPGSTAEILRRFWIEPQPGVVAQFQRTQTGGLADGLVQCAILHVPPEGLSRSEPVTESLWRRQLRLVLPGARAFTRGSAPPSVRQPVLARTTGNTWLDLPAAEGHDWKRGRLEQEGDFTVALAVEFAAEPADGGGGGERPVSRVLAFGSPDGLSTSLLAQNRDFALNAFNWLASREGRLVVRPRAADRRVLDLATTDALAVVHRVSVYALPGLCAVLGLLLAWRRRG
jgi:hypothetical protein